MIVRMAMVVAMSVMGMVMIVPMLMRAIVPRGLV
jgi:hypothetical protein